MRASAEPQEVTLPELPSGTVTFLFTDLEGSTRLWERHPATMGPALERHDALLRTAVERHRGAVVKTTGDGLHAVFTTAQDALAAAVGAQRALAAETWEVPGGLRVRMGMHTGDAVVRQGDYYGAATNRAARVMDSAHGGQIVVSNATAEILRDALPEAIALIDLGEHRLADLARPERISQVASEGLVREFPPLRTLDTVPGNLPIQVTSLVDRVVEREAIADASLASRLVTVTGVGGVGKSRLAVQVALDIAPRFASGAWLCDLAIARDGGAVAEIVAATFGIVARAGRTLTESVIDALRMRELVLVLDNCEHVLDAVGELVAGLLRDCPGVRILATSREPLGVLGEQLWPLTALALPAPDVGLDGAAESPAVQLFVERARAVQPAFSLDESNVAVVAEICRRLDGIPLAVELAAARVAVMTPADIASRLDQRFQLLTGGRRSAAERHQTLRAAMEWSYETLDPRERTVFEQLAAFPGTFDADAAVAVGSHDDLEAWDVLDACSSLVAKSMLTADDASGSTRFQMLETLRTFARERLEASGAKQTTFRRHAEHYMRFAEAADAGLEGPDEIEWRGRIALEFDNLRAAFIRSFQLGEDDDMRCALRIVASLAFEAMNDRGLRVGIWAEHLVPFVHLTTPEVRVAILAAAAYSAQGQHNIEALGEYTAAALREGVLPGSAGSVWAHIARASYEGMNGDLEASIAVIERAEEAFTAAGDTPRNLSLLYATAASFHSVQGNRAEAVRDALHALDLARDAHNPTAVVSAQFALAVALAESDPEAAALALDESINLGRQGLGGGLLGFGLARRAALRAQTGELAGATADAREALLQGRERGDLPMLSSALQCSVPVLTALGRHEAAAIVVGAQRAGVTTGRPRERLGAIVSDLGIDDALDEARAVLGEDEYRQALERGARLPRDDVLEYVINALDVAELATR
jgi:predicted ATPase/class 3 adenylate cyclase